MAKKSFLELRWITQVLVVLVVIGFAGQIYLAHQLEIFRQETHRVILNIHKVHHLFLDHQMLIHEYVLDPTLEKRQKIDRFPMLNTFLPVSDLKSPAVILNAAEIRQFQLFLYTQQKLAAIQAQVVGFVQHAETGAIVSQAAITLLESAETHALEKQSEQQILALSDGYSRRVHQAKMLIEHKQSLLRLFSIISFALMLYLVWRDYRRHAMLIGTSVDHLHDLMTSIYRGESVDVPEVPLHKSSSLLGRLAEIQNQLHSIKVREDKAQADGRQQADLYLALRQCNFAIVRSQSRQALFEQICRVVVLYGHARMAWIGMLDQETSALHVAASYGDGVDDLAQISISINHALPDDNEPIILSVTEDIPCWVHDFQTYPLTEALRTQASQYGWKSLASLPLHAGNTVIGCLCLYAGKAHAFDPETQLLLTAMVTDVDFALERFAMQQERSTHLESLRMSEEAAHLVLENARDAIINIDAYGFIVEWNHSAERIFGYSRQEVLGRSLGEVIVPPVHREAHNRGLARLLHTGEPRLLGQLIEITALHRNGTEFPVELTIVHIQRHAEHYYSAFVRDISKRKAAEEKIQLLANYDALTGLPNRNLLKERVEAEIRRASDARGQFAMLFMDIDHFKDVNDSLGHRYGDALLIELSKRFRSLVSNADTICRLGGDEFVFLLSGADYQSAKNVVEGLLQLVEQPLMVEQYQLAVTASIGIAMYPGDGTDIDSLQRNADVAMYRTKKESRNGYRFFNSGMQVQSARNLQLINALRQAIPLGQMSLHYQPQLDLSSEKIVGVEALLRWVHPELGNISPTEFIPLAESGGLIISIGHWVLEQAVDQMVQWQKVGIAGIRMAVNISSIQFRDPDFPTLVQRILNQYHLPPECLELELTEGVALENPEGAIAILDTLNSLGVSLSIDDFGTGYSSLSYLKKFKAYKLKIDRSFVRDINIDDEDKAIVIAIIQLARSLGLKTIAEGVETEEQRTLLQAEACDEMQGYLFSKPMSAEDTLVFLRQQKNVLLI